MDSAFLLQQLRQFIFGLASSAPTVFLGALGIGVFGLGPIGRSLAARIRGTPRELDSNDRTVAALRATIAELQERLDFSERALAVVRRQLTSGGQIGASSAGPETRT